MKIQALPRLILQRTDHRRRYRCASSTLGTARNDTCVSHQGLLDQRSRVSLLRRLLSAVRWHRPAPTCASDRAHVRPVTFPIVYGAGSPRAPHRPLRARPAAGLVALLAGFYPVLVKRLNSRQKDTHIFLNSAAVTAAKAILRTRRSHQGKNQQKNKLATTIRYMTENQMPV